MSETGGAITRGDVARGAGLAGLARLGAVVEALAQPLFVWLFGLATYGLYVVLWGAINFLSNIVDLSMTSALQRVVPTLDAEERAHGAVKLALLVSVLPATLIAALVALNADSVAGLVSAAPEDRAALPGAIRLFVWALPLWTFIEVATSAARARRAFGPEIRLRIFWEQIARIAFAGLFFALGMKSTGLMAAHLCSLALTAALCVPLLARYYDLRLILVAPVGRAMAGTFLGSGVALLPANLSRRLLIDGPPVILNLMLPGTRGAIAAAPLYRFASRVSTALVVPLAGLLIFAGADILSVYRPEAAAALPLLYALVAARAVEAIVGPATPIVEMTGHRILPLVNSLIGVALWAALVVWLVPEIGPMGMAVAVGAATLLIAYAATLELSLSDGLSPFDRKLFQALAIALAGVALMALAEHLTRGPVRFASVLSLWALTSWCALRFGLQRGDREAFGGFARRLRLV